MPSHKKKVLVGVFLIGGAVLFALGLFLIGSSQGLFASHFTVYTGFNNIDTLVPGAKVRVSGMAAGQVAGIEVPKTPSSPFRLKLEIDRKFRPLIREDSVATIETQGMVGNQYVDVKKGSAQSPEIPTGGTIHSQEPTNIGDLMRKGGELADSLQATIKDLRGRADRAIQNVTDLTGNANGMIVSVRGDVRKIASNTAQLTGNANAIAAGIREGHGTAGKLLTDKAVAANVTDTIAQAKQVSQKLNAIVSSVQQKDLPPIHQTVENAKDMTGQLNQAVGTFLAKGKKNGNMVVTLRDTVQQARRTVANLADDTEAIKHNFLFRGFFNRRGFYSMEAFTPEKYASSRFVKKPTARVWIAGAGMFTSGSNGQQELSKEGKAILDQNMSALVPYLPRNPIVVEGYAIVGMPDERYRVSRARAVEVRSYLISQFHLNPKMVGVMPLADQPPKGVGKQIWNGICLVLVASKKQ